MQRIRVIIKGFCPAAACTPALLQVIRCLQTVRTEARGVVGIALIALLIAWPAACMQSISPYGSKPGQTRSRPATHTAADEQDEIDLPAGAVEQLTINAETIHAADILAAERPDLLERARRLPPEEYSTYLGQRAAIGIMRKIADVLLYQHASKLLSESEQRYIDKIVDGEIRKIVTADFGGSQRGYEKHLAEQGRSIEDAHEEMKRQIVVMRHVELNLKPKVVEPTRAELLALFKANADQWRRPPRRAMSLIDVRFQDRLPQGVESPSAAQLAAAKNDARQRIEAAASQVRNGALFAAAAREYSDGLHAEDGGAWGWVTVEGVRDQFRPAVEALYQLEAGAISGIIETDEGFFLVRCAEVDPGVEPSFADVQVELKERHLREEYARLEHELIEKLQREATITPPDLDGFLLAVMASAPRPGDG